VPVHSIWNTLQSATENHSFTRRRLATGAGLYLDIGTVAVELDEQECFDNGGAGRSKTYFEVTRLLAQVRCIVRQDEWNSRSEARNSIIVAKPEGAAFCRPTSKGAGCRDCPTDRRQKTTDRALLARAVASLELPQYGNGIAYRCVVVIQT